jgi:ABC-2 type transport system permease protein
MSAAFLLLRLSLKRARTLLIATGLLLVVFQFLLVIIAGSVERAGEFEQIASLLPRFVRMLMGSTVASVMSFAGVVCLGYFDLGIVIALVALSISLATVPAAEVESGFADLILARPLRRHWLITKTIVLVTLSILIMMGVMTCSTWAGLALLAPKGARWPTPQMVFSLAFNLGLLMLCWGGVALALGAACRRTVAGAVTGLLALGSLLLDITGRLWPPAESIAWLSPFRYFIPFDLVMGTALPIENVLVLWSIALTGFVLAYFFFSQRDISH